VSDRAGELETGRRFQDRRGRAGVVDAVELRPELGTHCFEAGARDGH
jgi:hypothetical protein